MLLTAVTAETTFNVNKLKQHDILAEDQILIKMWPADSPGLNPVDYRIWGKLWERVYRKRICDVDQLSDA